MMLREVHGMIDVGESRRKNEIATAKVAVNKKEGEIVNLQFFTADMSLMKSKTKACHVIYSWHIMKEMRIAPAATTPTNLAVTASSTSSS
jgi:hypothetical protein